MENIGTSIRGIYRDILKTPDNTVIFDSGWKSNIVVDRCRALLSAFMGNEQTRGIQALKMGKGDAQWDVVGTPAPDAGITGLTDPDPFTVAVGDLDIVYLDDNEEPVEAGQGPTSKLQITVTLGQDLPPGVAPLSSYPLREFGLFGEYTDDSGVVHEYMIDCIRHPVINKDVSATMVRTVKLYF